MTVEELATAWITLSLEEKARFHQFVINYILDAAKSALNYAEVMNVDPGEILSDMKE